MRKRKRREPTITIKDAITNDNTEVCISLYYKIFCRKVVSKYFNVYRSVFISQGIEQIDLEQDIFLMLWEILKENKKTKKIPTNKVGGYLFNATKRQLNNIVSKAVTTHRRMVSLSVYHADAIANEEAEEPKLDSEIFINLLDKKKRGTLVAIIKNVCTEKEAHAVRSYYLSKENTITIAKDMKISKQRVSALLKQAMLKLKIHCEERIEKSKELEKW